MSFAHKHNSNVNLFNYQTPKSHKYYSLSDLATDNGLDKVYKVMALFINTKSRYGNAPVIVTDNELVNVPSHLLETFDNIFKDLDSVNAINEGKVGFKIYAYTNSFGEHLSINWVDIKQ